tara:strand:+ start:14385 stop:14651 length:267 start_codon:yes stop_codon:yes gene_type:complete
MENSKLKVTILILLFMFLGSMFYMFDILLKQSRIDSLKKPLPQYHFVTPDYGIKWVDETHVHLISDKGIVLYTTTPDSIIYYMEKDNE